MAEGKDWLSRTLRELRTGAGLSGVQAGTVIGRAQARISRIEAGHFIPTTEEIRKLCDAYKAPAATRRELLRAVEDLRAGTTSARLVMHRNAWKIQSRIRRIEAAAAEICVFQPILLPGLLQTPAYMRLVFADGGDITGEALDRCVAERTARQDILGSDRDFTFIIPEGALRWQAGSPEVMTDQLEHLAEVTRTWPQMRIGVIPQAQPAEVFPTNGFNLVDRRTVIVGTRSGTNFIADPADVAEYAKLFGELEALARFGAGALAVIGQVAAGYRDLR